MGEQPEAHPVTEEHHLVMWPAHLDGGRAAGQDHVCVPAGCQVKKTSSSLFLHLWQLKHTVRYNFKG